MSARPIAVLNTGVVTAVGLTAASACAAIRAKLTNPQEMLVKDRNGEPLMGYRVPIDDGQPDATKLVRMASLAITECLADIPKPDWQQIPLWLCVAEKSRPGRVAGLDDRLFLDICSHLGARFADQSAIVAQGRASIGTALYQARKQLLERDVPHVLIVAVDSLLNIPTLSAFEEKERLLTSANSNGFIPGEAAGAVLLGRPSGAAELLCTGLGFGIESATLESEQPQRAEGLVQAFRAALSDAGCALHELDFRITDLSGEQYYFKEASLALTRVMRQRKEEFDIWHAAECTGEIGAAAGPVALAVAQAACRKAYAPGPGILFHSSNDSGERVAAVLTYGAQ
jgi:3-oxoacyl-[acyl-carrier-protein] synthase-1